MSLDTRLRRLELALTPTTRTLPPGLTDQARGQILDDCRDLAASGGSEYIPPPPEPTGNPAVDEARRELREDNVRLAEVVEGLRTAPAGGGTG